MSAATIRAGHAGAPVAPSLTFTAPHILTFDGREIENFGADRGRAMNAYMARRREYLSAHGIQSVYLEGGCTL